MNNANLKRGTVSMNQLLKLSHDKKWDLEGITFALEERIGNPELFTGRISEMEYLYDWSQGIKNKFSRTIAYLGRRKIGKSLMIERLYNIIYSENDGLIPFYYEFKEGKITAKDFAEGFVTKFYMQVIGYYTRDIKWIRESLESTRNCSIKQLYDDIGPEIFKNKEIIMEKLRKLINRLGNIPTLYDYISFAIEVPHAFATTVGIEEKVVQMIDEFQYLNDQVDVQDKDIPSKAYMSTAESKVAPLLVTGSFMGVLADQLTLYTPHRFMHVFVPEMVREEAHEMILNYGKVYKHHFDDEIADYIYDMTAGVPGRIIALLSPILGKPTINNKNDVDEALQFEVTKGTIRNDWFEYLYPAIKRYNDANLKKIIFFLCKNEGKMYYPKDIKEALGLKISEETLRQELQVLNKYDLIEKNGAAYGGVFDRTLKTVFMAEYGDLLSLPHDDFNSYFSTENRLDYIDHYLKRNKLAIEETEQLKKLVHQLRGENNHLKGHHYEYKVCVELISDMIKRESGIAVHSPLTENLSLINLFF